LPEKIANSIRFRAAGITGNYTFQALVLKFAFSPDKWPLRKYPSPPALMKNAKKKRNIQA
jgi:hypothetical protein